MDWFSFACGAASGWVSFGVLMGIANLIDRNMGYRK